MGKISRSHLKLLINIQDDLKKNWPFLFCSKQVTEFVWVTFIPEKILFVSANKVDLHLLRNDSQRYLCIPSESEIWLWSTVKTLGSFASVFRD